LKSFRSLESERNLLFAPGVWNPGLDDGSDDGSSYIFTFIRFVYVKFVFRLERKEKKRKKERTSYFYDDERANVHLTIINICSIENIYSSPLSW
jgi:hypothetical protein